MRREWPQKPKMKSKRYFFSSSDNSSTVVWCAASSYYHNCYEANKAILYISM